MLATLFGRNLSSSDFSSSLSYLSRKKGTSETFLSLSLFISRPRPTASASKIRLRLRKTFPQFPFFYFGNLEKLKSDEDKFFLRVASTIIETKYYFFLCRAVLLKILVPEMEHATQVVNVKTKEGAQVAIVLQGEFQSIFKAVQLLQSTAF